ncbi:MAG: hypothetical protein IJB19_05745 [Clostridia bacterium]|nr:hypothetical protein [Clostridia bacterium]
MKKQILLFAFIIGIFLNVCAFAASTTLPEPIEPCWDNILDIQNGITFVDNTGYYTVTIMGQSGTSNITAIAKLYYKNDSGQWSEIPQSWTFSENSNCLAFEKTFSATSGIEYKVDLSISVVRNGTFEPATKTVTATCP